MHEEPLQQTGFTTSGCSTTLTVPPGVRLGLWIKLGIQEQAYEEKGTGVVTRIIRGLTSQSSA